MSGTGKSTLLAELAHRGHHTADTDYDGWTLPDGTWDEPRMTALLATHDTIAVSGTVPNQGRFYPYFAHVVLLSAPLPLLLDRVSNRTTNPYGRTPSQRALIARHAREIGPLLRRGATTELDARLTVTTLADTVELLLRSP